MTQPPASTLLSRLQRFASSIAPGIFMIGYVIGTGSVTTMASAGASYGMTLTWTLAAASLFTFLIFVGISRLTILSGETVLHNFRRNFGSPVTLLIIAGLCATQIASIIGVMAIVTEVVQEYTRPWTASGEGISPAASGLFFTVLLCALFWRGRHEFFLKALAVMVGLMGVSFLITFGLVMPDMKEILAGLVPSVPPEGNPQLLIAGMVGTTMASVCVFTRSILVKEKRWTTEDFRTESRDSLISVTLMFVINTAIMGCAAGTLFLQGMHVENAIDMVKTLEPLAGRMAVTGFVIGIVSAGLSSLFPNYLLGPWIISDYLGIDRDLGRKGFRILVLATASFSMVVPLFGGRPVALMIASQALSPLIMPLIALFVLLLLNKRTVAGSQVPARWLNLGLGVTVLFSIYMLTLSATGFFAALMGR